MAFRGLKAGGSSAVGEPLHAAMSAAPGPDRIVLTALGPIIEEDDILAMALGGGCAPDTSVSIVPAEASASGYCSWNTTRSSP